MMVCAALRDTEHREAACRKTKKKMTKGGAIGRAGAQRLDSAGQSECVARPVPLSFGANCRATSLVFSGL